MGSRATVKINSDVYCKFVMDFCVWGAAKAKMPAACTSRHEMLGHIQRVSNELRDTLGPEKVMAAFEARISALIPAEGDTFEI